MTAPTRRRILMERMLFCALIALWFVQEQLSALHQATSSLPTEEVDNSPSCFESLAGRNKEENISQNNSTVGSPSSGLQRTKLSVLDLFDSALPTYEQAGGKLSKPLVLTNIIRRSQSNVVTSDDIVLVTQMGVSKAYILLVLLDYWNGPASVAVYIKDRESIVTFFDFVQEHASALVNATFHLAMEKPDSPDGPGPAYPHNILRNVALETVESDFVILLDVDFIPSPNAHEKLSTWLRDPQMDLKHNMQKNRTVYVVPAFELLPPRRNTSSALPHMLPRSKSELVQMYNNHSVYPFKTTWILGHFPTNFAYWMKLAQRPRTKLNAGRYSYPIEFVGRTKEFFEPYIVAYRPILPRYWEHFRGFGQNKVSFYKELLRPKYAIHWEAFRDLYCIHLDHPTLPIDDKQIFEKANKPFRKAFDRYLEARYPND